MGGSLFDHSGYRATFVASAVLLLIATILTFLTSRSEAAHSS
jgi:predicted MFS family arabinose efflux permease